MMYARIVFVQGFSNPYSDCSRSFIAWTSTLSGSPSGESIKFIMTGGPMLGCSMNSTGITLVRPGYELDAKAARASACAF